MTGVLLPIWSSSSKIWQIVHMVAKLEEQIFTE